MKMKTLFAVIFLSSLALIAACTVTPKPLKDTLPSLDGGQMNSGFLGFYGETNNRVGVISDRSRQRYDLLAETYGTRFLPPLKPGDGLTAFTNGTWLIDKEHLRKFSTMSRWRKSDAVAPE